MIPSPHAPGGKNKPSVPLGDLQWLVSKDICKFAVILDFAEIRERINIPYFLECWRLEYLYFKGFSIHAICSVDAALSTQSRHIVGSILKLKWRFSNIEVGNVSEYTTQAD